ncbi:MAG: DUF6584 family protein [Anaerolineae bacterium]
MPLAQTLERVQEDVHKGDYGKAIARLHGLLGSYPENLDLRKRLGEAYWNLQMPAMAGRYWYLVEDKDERMQAACKRFEDEFRNDPFHMLSGLKFKGDPQAIKGTYAGRVLDDLERRASKKYPWYEGFRKKGSEEKGRPQDQRRPRKVRDFFFRLGCLLIVALAASFALIGLFTAVSALVKWLR